MVVCEEFVTKILPYVRACFVEKLASKGFNQKEIAKKMEISQPLVSMYLNGKRGDNLDPKLKKDVKDIVKGLEEFQICPVCRRLRDDIPR